MKKYIIPTLAAFVLLTTSTAFAQVESVEHELFVSIPEVVMIRIVTPLNAAGVNAAGFVDFDYADTAFQDDYFTALENGGGQLPPTGGNITDIEVLAIGTTWRVDVSAEAFTLGGVSLADIEVTPGATWSPFTLDAGTGVMGGNATNWLSLGINTASYALSVNGDEAAGNDTITVTYTIVDL